MTLNLGVGPGGPSVLISVSWPALGVVVVLMVAVWWAARKHMRGRLKSFTVNLPLLVGEVSGTWEPDLAERKAAWALYVELVTRVTGVALRNQDGLLREALSSCYSLFDTTRRLLREYGPTLNMPLKPKQLSFASIAIAVLNENVRPVLSKWHPLLLDYESSRPDTVSPVRHERAWDKYEECLSGLNTLRSHLDQYLLLLEEVVKTSSFD